MNPSPSLRPLAVTSLFSLSVFASGLQVGSSVSCFRFHLQAISHGICPSQEQVWIEGKRNTGQGRTRETDDPKHKLCHTDTLGDIQV